MLSIKHWNFLWRCNIFSQILWTWCGHIFSVTFPKNTLGRKGEEAFPFLDSDLYRLTNTSEQNPLSGVLLMQCFHTTCYIRVSRSKDLLHFEPEGRRGDCFQFLPRKNYGDGRCESARFSPQNEALRAALPFRIATYRSITVQSISAAQFLFRKINTPPAPLQQ